MQKLFLKTLFILPILLFVSSIPFAQDVTRSRTIEDFFKANSSLRVSKGAVEAYKTALNQMSVQVIKKATKLAKKGNRRTVLERDITQAADDVFRRSPISVAEIMEKITQLPMIDLVELTNQVNAYGNKLLKKKKK